MRKQLSTERAASKVPLLATCVVYDMCWRSDRAGQISVCAAKEYGSSDCVTTVVFFTKSDVHYRSALRLGGIVVDLQSVSAYGDARSRDGRIWDVVGHVARMVPAASGSQILFLSDL